MSGAWLCKKIRHPWLGGDRRFDHVLGDARLRDLKPELEQFVVNARRAPKRILHAHPPDQYAQLHVDLRSPSTQPVSDVQDAARGDRMGQEEQPFAARRAIKLNRQAWPAYLSAPLIIIRSTHA